MEFGLNKSFSLADLGISDGGNPNLFLNQQGDWVVDSGTAIGFDNGLYLDGTTAKLGGNLIEDTGIITDGFTFVLENEISATRIVSFLNTTAGGFSASEHQAVNDDLNATAKNGAYLNTATGIVSASMNYQDADGETTIDVFNQGIEINIATDKLWNAEDSNTFNWMLYMESTGLLRLGHTDAQRAGTTTEIANSIKEDLYTSTRDDTGTFTPVSFFYPGAAGERYVAPLSAFTAKSFTVASNNASIAANTINYISPFIGNVTSLSEVDRQYIARFDFTVSDLSITTSTTQPASGSFVFTVRKNGAPTALVVTIPAGGVAGTYANLTDSASFVAGDLLSIELDNNATLAPSAIARTIATTITTPLNQ